MSRPFGFAAALAWLLVTILIAGTTAVFAYHAGTMSAVTAAAGGGYLVHPYWGGYGWGPGFGFGFLFPIVAILLLVLLFRSRHRHGGWYGPPRGFDRSPRERFEEWHRELHAGEEKSGGEPPHRS